MFRSIAVRAGLFGLHCLLAAVSAQVKVGVINVQDAILKSDEMKKAASDLDAKYKVRQNELQKLQSDLQSIEQQLGARQTESAGRCRSAGAGQRKQRDLQRLSQDLQTDVDADRNEILTKAGAKMRTVVEKLAADKGLRHGCRCLADRLLQTSTGHHQRSVDGIQQGESRPSREIAPALN